MTKSPDHPDARASTWSDEQLEAFHDGELASDLARSLSRDLAEDAPLRDRLREIQRCDELVLRSLTRTAQGADPAGARPTRLWRAMPSPHVIVATLVACVGIVVITLALRPRAERGPGLTLPPGAGSATITQGPPRTRVLVSLPGGSADALFNEPARDTTPRRNVRAEALGALAEGDSERALELVRSDSPAERREALAALGLALSVEARALELLDAMTPAEQLEACEIWATDPRFRAATFSRLRKLTSHPDLGPRVLDLLEEMESQPALAAWVRSYRPRS